MSEAAESFLTDQSRSSHAGPAGPGSHGPDANLSAGGMLRQAREAAGLHIAALAVSLKVPVKKLEALEADRFELLPDAVFVRALASSVCRTLKIDAAPVLGRLPQTSRPALTYQGVGINTPFRTPGDGPGPSVWAQVSRPAVLAGIVLLLGALVLIFLPALKTGVEEVSIFSKDVEKFPASVAVPQTVSTDATKPDVINADTGVAAVTQSPATLSGAVPGMTQTVVATPAAAAVATSLVSVDPPSQPAVVKPVAAASSTPAVPPAGIVVFTAKGESWVEVTDAKRQVVLRRILSAGEMASASGALPLAAVVGRADATDVQVRGKAFDMSTFAKDNVARFEVK